MDGDLKRTSQNEGDQDMSAEGHDASARSGSCHENELPGFISSLFRYNQMRRFKDIVRDLGYQLGGGSYTYSQDDHELLDKIIENLSSEVSILSEPNASTLNAQFTHLKQVYEDALNTDPSKFIPDMKVYTSQDVAEYGLEFISQIDPRYVHDINTNWGWYLN